MSKKNIKYWPGVIIILLIGILLLYIEEKFAKGSYPTISSILNKASTAAFVTGLFSFLNKIILDKNLIELIYNKINLKQAIDEVGVLEMFTDISEIEYKSHFKNAKKEIDILHVYGQTWTSNNEQSILTAIQKQKCKVRVALLSPESPFVGGLASYYNYPEEKLKKKIDEAKNTWNGIYSRLSKGEKKRLNVYCVNMLPAYAMYRFDEIIIKVDARLISSSKTKELNSVICIDNDFEVSYYSNYKKDFDELISNSKTKNILKKAK